MGFGGANWDKLFKKYDKDKSGDIDPEEFIKLVRQESKINAI